MTIFAIVDESAKIHELGNRMDLMFHLGEYRWLLKVPADLSPDVGDELRISWDDQRGEMRAY